MTNRTSVAMLVGLLGHITTAIARDNLGDDDSVLNVADPAPEPFTEKSTFGKIQKEHTSRNKKRNFVNKRHYR